MSRRKIIPLLPEDDDPIVRDARNIRNRKIDRLPSLDGRFGKEPDLALAREYNLALSYVRARRVGLGISAFTTGRPKGPERVNLGTVRVLSATARWLAKRGQTAAQALDELSGSNKEQSD